MEIKTGYMPFRGYRTFYRVVGERNGNKAPLLLLHGGPGSTHNYFELLDSLADSGRQIVMYDQLGCGLSYVEGHAELWTLDTWLDELDALRKYLQLDTLHVLGQSWGGMMILAWLIDRKPKGVMSAILSSTLSSSRLWSSEQHRLITFLSEEDQQAIRLAEETGDYTNSAYLRANEHYTEKYAGLVEDSTPECVRRKKRFGTESYNAAWGPNEFTPLGNLRNFDYTERLGEIRQSCLVISGTNDECTPLIAKTMADGIAHSRWELLAGARHMTFVDQTDAYLAIVGKWCEEHDGQMADIQSATR
ncbi:MAG: proline iminopeptidase [Prevotella sp.]